MTMKSYSVVISLMLVLLLGNLSLPLLAQHQHKEAQHPDKDMVLVGKKGEVTFTSKVRVGDAMLEPGEYQIKHVVEGNDHVVSFTRMRRPGGYSAPTPGKEVARVKCKLEPLGEKAKNTMYRSGSNAAGEKTIEEVYVAGENVKHVF